MKKVIYFISVLSLPLFSCSPCDPSDDSSSEAELSGKWEAVQFRSFPVGTTITGYEELFDIDHSCHKQKDYILFASDGTVREASYSSNCSEDADLGTYSKSDSLINFFLDDEFTGTWEILLLNKYTLKVIETNLSTEATSEVIVYTFKRV